MKAKYQEKLRIISFMFTCIMFVVKLCKILDFNGYCTRGLVFYLITIVVYKE